MSMTTGSSLIRGSAALFGIKSTLQFGKLTATALVSQQNSESRSVSTKGGVQTTKFSVNVDQYDQNRHFFLAHFFRDNYDTFRIQAAICGLGREHHAYRGVGHQQKSGNYNQSRNIVSFMDLERPGACQRLLASQPGCS